MDVSFFGLREKPFALTPNPRYLYLSAGHEEAFSALLYGIREEKGLVSLTGPVGVGKTTILYSFLDRVRDEIEAALLSGVTSEDSMFLFREIRRQFNLISEEKSLIEPIHDIKNFALEKRKEGKRTVLLVDEAQNLSLEALNHLRHLNNLEIPEAKLLQIVLVGSEELNTQLRDERFASLRQRIAIRCQLKPLDPESVIEYIFHRVHVAGNFADNLFTPDALWRIVHYAGGIPRRINVVCDNAMIVSFALKKIPVEEAFVLEAIQDLGGSDTDIPEKELIPKDLFNTCCQTISQRTREKVKTDPVSLNEAPGYRPEEGMRPEVNQARQGRPARVSSVSIKGADRNRTQAPESLFRAFLVQGRKTFWIALVFLCGLSIGVLMVLGAFNRDRREQQPVPTPLLEETSETRIEEVTPEEDQSPVQNMATFHNKDLGAIALEHYGRLNREIVKMLGDSNPHVRDWNSLDPSVDLVMPEISSIAGTGVDFYSVQVASFRLETTALEVAEELSNKGIQNIFIFKGKPASSRRKRWIGLCVGVFETPEQSAGMIKRAQDLGFSDAFTINLQKERSEDIITLEKD